MPYSAIDNSRRGAELGRASIVSVTTMAQIPSPRSAKRNLVAFGHAGDDLDLPVQPS